MKRNNFIQRINNSFAKFAEWVLDHRPIVIITCIILCIGSASLTLNLRTDFNFFHFLPENDPTVEDYMDFLKEYGNDDFIYLVYKAEPGVFDLDILRKTRSLVEELEGIPFVKKVNSIINLEFIEGSSSGDLKDFKFIDNFPSSQIEADRLKSRLLDKPLYENIYISKDTRYAAILCNLKDKPEGDGSNTIKTVESLNRILAKSDYNDFEFYPTGGPIFGFTFLKLVEENVRLFLPAIILLTLLSIFLFRQFKGVIGPFVVIQVVIVLVLGLMAMADFPITIMFSMIPAAVMSIGMADAVHIISEYQIHLKAGIDNRTSILKAVKLLGFPCLFTSITTAAGFASLATSSVGPIRDLGLSIAFGTMAALVVTFTILIMILSFNGAKAERKFEKSEIMKNHGFIDWALLKIAHLNNRYYKKILLISGIACIILIYGVTKIEINTEKMSMFGEEVKMFNDFKFVDKTMGGSANFEVLLDSGNADGIKTFQFVRTLEKIQNFVNSEDYLVGKTISVIDFIKDVNRALNNNDRAFYRVPSSDGEELQNVNEFIYELYGGEELETMVSADHREARITIRVESSNSKIYNQFQDNLVSFIESIKPVDYTYRITGMSFIDVEANRKLTGSMSKSIMLAIAVISVLMIVVFRSFRIGLISMIPNVFPILFGLGFMGVSGIHLSQITSTVGCIIIGLVVDDTIHFISRYRMEFASLGNYREALEVSLRSVGRALVITTIILVLGFGILMNSRMASFFEMGLLTSLCFIVALIADFFIAPAVIMVFKPFGEEFTPGQENIEESLKHTSEEPAIWNSVSNENPGGLP